MSRQLGDPLIAARIKELRRDRLGLRQGEFAREVGVGQPVVSLWETAENRPSTLALLKIGDLAGEDRLWWYAQAGPEHAAKLKAEAAPVPMPAPVVPPVIDRELLAYVIQGLMRELAIRGNPKVAESDLAHAIARYYDECHYLGKRIDAMAAAMAEKLCELEEKDV